MNRWFVELPAGPDTWWVVFGPRGLPPDRVWEIARMQRIETPKHWAPVFGKKPRWSADENAWRKVRGWRRAHSLHLGSGVRAFKVAKPVKRNDSCRPPMQS